jgi:hypothetical protein
LGPRPRRPSEVPKFANKGECASFGRSRPRRACLKAAGQRKARRLVPISVLQKGSHVPRRRD